MTLSRTTLMQWVGASSQLLGPLVAALAIRQQYAVPLLKSLHTWMMESLSQIEKKSELAEAFRYSLNRWEALCRYAHDGRLEIDNNIAERSIRGIGTGRRNYLFFGSDSDGERAAIIYSLVESCKLNHIDPQRYLHYVLERIADHPINRIDELLAVECGRIS